MIAAVSGLLAGAVHVVSGPDHLAALAPAVSRAPSRALTLGASWGLGHGAGVLVAALVGRALGGLIGLEPLSAWAELWVGVVLVALGARALVRVARPREERPPRARGAFSIGVLHGAAGAHHLFFVLPALVLEPAAAAAYLVAYLLAAVAAMAGLGALAALGLRGRGERARRVAHGLSGVGATVVGVVWIAMA